MPLRSHIQTAYGSGVFGELECAPLEQEPAQVEILEIARPEREVAIDDFFQGVFTTALGADELVTAVRVPATGAGTGAAYVKKAHPASGYAVAGAAAVVSTEGGSCTAARIAIGGVTGMSVRATVAEQVLVGQVVSLEAATRAADAVAQSLGSGEIGDTYASAEYRVHLATVLAKRVIATAIERAG